ncbi:hypothetical protein PEX1_086970 [Penicillium expansum]|uniref:Uncharacterized protein n=1 Tax=Penicillium expansum TaxID=27334 RepID=A0A0A2IUM3_PENEN|nr:hypothetical protein PEX2_088600 [Penicillium expansum]KGO43885.1 hypothetical protein PEXP_092540 [Penicillium expansum]KGO46129.1 hypothetical protein PEX1_086970 [Penicillium expansum]KGO57461.1 hypothetical protein PEX2_088600 [Penicillium expansum]
MRTLPGAVLNDLVYKDTRVYFSQCFVVLSFSSFLALLFQSGPWPMIQHWWRAGVTALSSGLDFNTAI